MLIRSERNYAFLSWCMRCNETAKRGSKRYDPLCIRESRDQWPKSDLKRGLRDLGKVDAVGQTVILIVTWWSNVDFKYVEVCLMDAVRIRGPIMCCNSAVRGDIATVWADAQAY
jgi:hypothetical protein